MSPGDQETPRWPPVQYYAKITVTVLLVLLGAYLLDRARAVLVLIFLGLLIAVGLEPAIQWAQRRGIRRGLCVLGFGMLLAGLLTALAFLVVAPAAEEISGFARSVPDLLSDLQKHVRGTALGQYLQRSDAQKKIEDGVSTLLENSVGGILGVLGGAISAAFTAVTLLILTVYFMLALPRLRRALHRILVSDERQAVVDESLSKVGGYISGQLVICACAGITSYIALTLLSAPYPALLAIMITVLDAIPQVGATIGAVIAVLAALTVSLPVAIGALLFFVIYQQLENYLIAPRVFSRAVALTPLASLLSVLIGAALAGVVGAIVALPVTSAASVIFRSTTTGRRLGPDPGEPGHSGPEPGEPGRSGERDPGGRPGAGGGPAAEPRT